MMSAGARKVQVSASRRPGPREPAKGQGGQDPPGRSEAPAGLGQEDFGLYGRRKAAVQSVHAPSLHPYVWGGGIHPPKTRGSR